MKLVCGHDSEYSNLFNASDYITGEIFPIIRCDQCGLAQTQVNVDTPEYAKYYPKIYYGEDKRYNSLLTRITNIFNKYRFRNVEKYLMPGSDILDLGCGQGWSLDMLRKKGHKTLGVEFSEAAAFHAKLSLDLNVKIGDVRDLELAKERFDFIIIWHVFEHVTQPERLLEHIVKLLKPEGVILLSVPNYSSPEARFTGAHWFHLDPPRHLSHFEKQELVKMFEKTGLETLHDSNFIPEYDFFSIIQSLFNKMGLQKNALYGYLRSTGNGAIMEQSLNFSSMLISILLLPVMIPFSLLWVLFVVLTKNGATQTYVLKKNRIQDDSREKSCRGNASL